MAGHRLVLAPDAHRAALEWGGKEGPVVDLQTGDIAWQQKAPCHDV